MSQPKYYASTNKYDIFSNLNHQLSFVFWYVPVRLELLGLEQFLISCLKYYIYFSHNLRADRYDSFVREANLVRKSSF
jgi:hypothetical protein